jgi:hypothetical protein
LELAMHGGGMNDLIIFEDSELVEKLSVSFRVVGLLTIEELELLTLTQHSNLTVNKSRQIFITIILI